MRYHRLAGLVLVVVLAARPALAQNVASKYVPADTEVVFTINFQQILGSGVAQAHKELVQQARLMIEGKLQESGAQQYLQKAGLDPFRDLRSLTVAGPGSKDTDRMIVIIEGKFDPAKLKTAATAAAGDAGGAIVVSTLDNEPLYEIAQPSGKTVYVSAVGSDILLAAPSKDLFRTTAAQIRNGRATELPQGFKTLLQTTSDKQSLSLAATGPALARLADAAPNANELVAAYLKNVTGMSLAITLARDVQFQLGINATDKEAAENFSKMGNSLLIPLRGMLQQKAKEEARLAPAVEVAQTLRIMAQGNNVVLRGEVSFETLGKIVKNLPQR